MKKILSSLMLLALVVGLVGAGTIATFYDTESSSGNIFTAGTLDLGLANNDGLNPRDDIEATWVIGNWAPGDTYADTLYVNNEGTIGAGRILLSFTAGAQVDGTPTTVNDHLYPAGVLADEIFVQSAAFGGTPINGLVGKTLSQLIAVSQTNLGPLPANTEKPLDITWEFDDDAVNSLQGDSITVTLTLRAEQI